MIYKRRELRDGFLSFFIACYEKNEKKKRILHEGEKNARRCVKIDRLVMSFFSFSLLSYFPSRMILIYYNLI